MSKKWSRETVCVQGGYVPKKGEPRVLPIYQSTTYKYDDPDYVMGLFDLKEEGHMYSRISNPTVEAIERKVNALEGGVGALVVSSGQSATLLAILNICNSGEHILAASTIYGGSHSLLGKTLKNLGIAVTFFDVEAEEEEILSYCKPETKAIFAEVISNPGLNIIDFDKFSNISKKVNIPLIVDNTFPTPYLCNPLKHGANIVIHSATKYMDGHATSVGGVIVDGGNFNWENGKYPGLTEPDSSYHGIRYVEEFKEKAYIVKARVQLLRDMGTALSPFNGFLINLGLETLHLRMKRHSQNALALARYLSNHHNVNWVGYPGLEDHRSHELCKKYLPLGAGGMLTFGIRGGKDTAMRFMKELKITALVVHMGDARTSVLHPATTTHRQLDKKALEKSLVTEDMIRVSVGIENIEDILNDFEYALKEI
ncbi:O-acetylhomoserine aminocarboxypropyltransferase/cysteine synthase family protein [Clostridiisalibacter paucivorans]|uniref:O-acetylhomoserine aminocarboxypropyltransferase/cysteine synthase family protein n=1 Tax=Clostridiisalibacter paucivorans TaxID=408753 RepID=UPI00047BA98F|nr:O-acetylhomoserine aminocarboxypropyltransferase/cysteine synthase family protein [Clostridiisalibacter paucivorans]